MHLQGNLHRTQVQLAKPMLWGSNILVQNAGGIGVCPFGASFVPVGEGRILTRYEQIGLWDSGRLASIEATMCDWASQGNKLTFSTRSTNFPPPAFYVPRNTPLLVLYFTWTKGLNILSCSSNFKRLLWGSYPECILLHRFCLEFCIPNTQPLLDIKECVRYTFQQIVCYCLNAWLSSLTSLLQVVYQVDRQPNFHANSELNCEYQYTNICMCSYPICQRIRRSESKLSVF